jgi:hypothetical protein
MSARNPFLAQGCVVCGVTDARELCATTLGDGSEVPICGSHELSLRLARVTPRTVEELRALTIDRRSRTDRRARCGDELGLLLSEAFAPKRRRASERRSGGRT